MKNSVLISIKPEWCVLIANGIKHICTYKKTVEVRKSKPKLETPFKCYIYCTSVKSMNLQEYVNVHQTTGGAVDDWSSKIIGEFVCDYIDEIDVIDHAIMTYIRVNGKPDMFVVYKTCLEVDELQKYLNGKTGYGWHISNLIIYDKPKDISEFGMSRPPQSWCYVEEARE